MQHVADIDTAAGTITVIDDYGHHPTEVAATLEALRQGYPGQRSCSPSSRTVIREPVI